MAQEVMAQEYARLPLLQEVTTADGKSKSAELIFRRPTAKDLAAMGEQTSISKRIETFIALTARAVNGGGPPVEFKAGELSSPDVIEIMDMIGSLPRDAENVVIGNGGDGINAPMVYTLQHPIQLTPGQDGGEVVHQIQFEARTLGELSEFLDNSGEANEFRTFMRLFGTLLGTKLPMNDAVINAIDFVDFYAIRNKIMGKLVQSRERWKKTST